MFLSRTVFEKNAMVACKIQSCTIVLISNFEILQDSISFFFDTLQPKNLKFIWNIIPYGYFLPKKFHVPQSLCSREKNDDKLQLENAFFSDTVIPRTLKFILYINPYGYSLQKNCMFLSCTVFEKNGMISCKNSMLHNCPNNSFEILQDSIAFFFPILCYRGT